MDYLAGYALVEYVFKLLAQFFVIAIVISTLYRFIVLLVKFIP